MTAIDSAQPKAAPSRFGGPRLFVSTPGGRMDEPLRDDVCRQVRRLLRCVAWLDPQDCEWWVEP